jgi:hypothetical protein
VLPRNACGEGAFRGTPGLTLLFVGSRGRKKRRRHPHLPKLHGDLGELPQPGDIGPWGPVGQIDAWGKIARASVSDDPRQRRASWPFLVTLALPALVVVIGLVWVMFFRG